MQEFSGGGWDFLRGYFQLIAFASIMDHLVFDIVPQHLLPAREVCVFVRTIMSYLGESGPVRFRLLPTLVCAGLVLRDHEGNDCHNQFLAY